MSKDLEKYDKLVVFLLVFAAFVFAIGWWFAEEKSAPQYSSKIDKLMFDKDNKSPRLVLTLPDKLEPRDKNKVNDIEVDVFADIVSSNKKDDELDDEFFSVERLLMNVPNIFNLPNRKQTSKLKNVSIKEDLTEQTKSGLLLPVISANGEKPWEEYGNFVTTQPNFKKIALVISGSGQDEKTSKKMYKIFNSEVSMSFSPYTVNKKSNISEAREFGHETYIDLLLSSKDFLKEDSGPMSLVKNIKINDALNILRDILNTKTPVGGVVIRDGLANEDNKTILTTLLQEIKNRGLLVIDATSSKTVSSIEIEGLPRQVADVVIDKDMKIDEIDNALKKAETIAFNKGQVLIVSDPKPVALVALYKWIDTFSPQVSYEESKNINITKPFALVPLSNIVVE
ncbi:MAG: divergent polysaccharide deacetylase family protein [Alphaproteobacteria bacterium]|nr:divergent polysaccharide deacetylase family protein [Alphaproteobacteria bacterium]